MEKILVIEDDESIRRELVTLLVANGYETVAEPPCDLALLDVNLPGESGFELCRQLRQHSDVPVIFLTGRDSAEDEILGFGVGADDYIRKPYHSSVLLARMARLLKRRSSPVMTARDLTLSFIQKAGREEALLSEYPYDIIYYSGKYDPGNSTLPPEEAESVIEKYAGIQIGRAHV